MYTDNMNSKGLRYVVRPRAGTAFVTSHRTEALEGLYVNRRAAITIVPPEARRREREAGRDWRLL